MPTTLPYSFDQPAENIEVLLEYLTDEQNEFHYFRGQNSFYEISVPSALRPAVTGPSADDPAWLELNQDPGFGKPARDRAKFSFRQSLLMVFGRVVGNLLTQQYGISSDAYDITGEPTMAAFFATRAYPSYEPFVPKDPKQPGVIYRFTIKTKTPPPLPLMERTLGSLYMVHEEAGKIWFDDVRSIRVRALKGEFRSQADVERHLNEVFPRGCSSGEFLKSAAYVPYEFIEAAFLAKAAEMKLVDAEAMIQSSRTFRQRGGLYFPPTMHVGFVSKHITVNMDGDLYVADPGRIETQGAQRVYNLNANPYVERFFFRHTPEKQIGVERLSLIWPGEGEDYLLQHLRLVCQEVSKQYLADFQTTPLDFDKGLIDPGYRNPL